MNPKLLRTIFPVVLLMVIQLVGPMVGVARSTTLPQQQNTDQTQDIAKLIQKLRSGNKSDWESAFDGLMQLGQPAINALIPLLKDAEPEVRSNATYILSQIGYTGPGPMATSAIPYLIPLFKDPYPAVRQNASAALGHMSASIPYLMPLLKDANSQVRSHAAFALGLAGGDVAAIQPLTALLKDADSDVRAHAAYALGRTAVMKEPTESVVPLLIPLLKDPAANVRFFTATALSELGKSAKPAIPALIAQVNDPDSMVRASVATAIGRIIGSGRPPSGPLASFIDPSGASTENTNELSELAMPALIPLLKDPVAKVRSEAVMAIGFVEISRTYALTKIT
jgi:HEAT repeat protein